MKKIYKNKIINIENTDLFDNRFLFDKLVWEAEKNQDIEIIYLSDLLEKRKNEEILKKVSEKPAMYSNVYSPKDEFEIFEELFENAIKNKKRIHIVWVTLKQEIDLLEEYYEKLWFLREDINCFAPDFSKPLVTVSVKIENLMWRWSDYKRLKEKIFFNPPIREAGLVKAMFKWINRWVIAWIYIEKLDDDIKNFLEEQVKTESILPITLAKTLCYNLEDMWLKWTKKELVVNY